MHKYIDTLWRTPHGVRFRIHSYLPYQCVVIIKIEDTCLLSLQETEFNQLKREGHWERDT